VAALGLIALVSGSSTGLGVARAAGGEITLRLWPAGQGRIELTQTGRPPRTCDFLDVLQTAGSCDVAVTSGTPVTLRAVAEPNATIPAGLAGLAPPDFPTKDAAFVRWSRFDCPGKGPCTFTPVSDQEWVTALFTPLSLEVGINGGDSAADTVKVQRAGGAPEPMTCVGAPQSFDTAERACHGLFPADTAVVLVANPSSSAVPVRWGALGCTPGAAVPTSARCTVTMSNIRTFATVAFGEPGQGCELDPNPSPPKVCPPLFPFQITPSLTVALSGSGQGSVKGPSGLDCPGKCSVDDLSYQSPITLTAAEGDGSTFVRWQGVCSTKPTCIFAAGSISAVGAVFDDSTPPRVKLTRVAIQGAGAQRALVVTVVADRTAQASLRLLRRGTTIASRGVRIPAGRGTLRLAVPRGASAGWYQVVLKLAGAGAPSLTRPVRIGG
jgi:hypothetical protein